MPNLTQILRLHAEYKKLISWPKSARNSSWKAKVSAFHSRVSSTLFDIAAREDRRRSQEAHYGVKMSNDEFRFLDDQRRERKMFCDSAVDRQWKKTAERKAREEESFRRQEAKAESRVEKNGEGGIHR